jgi:hypothetical protein
MLDIGDLSFGILKRVGIAGVRIRLIEEMKPSPGRLLRERSR